MNPKRSQSLKILCKEQKKMSLLFLFLIKETPRSLDKARGGFVGFNRLLLETPHEILLLFHGL